MKSVIRIHIVLVIIIGALLLISSTAHADTVTLDKARTVVIKGQINSPKAADAIFKLTTNSNTLPIDIVLSSPGGSINDGLVIDSAIKVAQTRGILVRCHVPVYAASMAFYILTQCSERYVLSNSFLLFHPARVGSQGGYTQQQLIEAAESLLVTEDRLKINMQFKMQMNAELFEKHYKLATLWLASDLIKETRDGFLKMVDDIINVPENAMFNSDDENPLSKLFGRII